MKKLSARSQLVNFAKKHPEGFTVAQARQHVKGTPSRISVLLWQLKKDGELKHDPKTGIYVLTDVNKPAETTNEVDEVKDLKNMLTRADSSYADLAGQLVAAKTENKKVKEHYEDALAIIRYLEDKLFKAIQYNARNGSNA